MLVRSFPVIPMLKFAVPKPVALCTREVAICGEYWSSSGVITTCCIARLSACSHSGAAAAEVGAFSASLIRLSSWVLVKQRLDDRAAVVAVPVGVPASGGQVPGVRLVVDRGVAEVGEVRRQGLRLA